MLIYPDSSDLIRLERAADERDFERLERSLRARNGQLVLSQQLIKEVALPMTSTMNIPLPRIERLMDQLERLPHVWLRTALERLELQTAIRCFTAQRPWEPVTPFAGTLADALEQMAPAARWQLRQMTLAQFVRLALPHDRTNPLAASFPELLRMNREAPAASPSQLRQTFGLKVMRLGPTLQEFSTVDAEALVQHLWKSPEWCPGMRLCFHVTNRFIGDKKKTGGVGDVEDLIRVAAVPYVDAFVADTSKREYLRQLARPGAGLESCSYWRRCRIVARLEEIVEAPEP